MDIFIYICTFITVKKIIQTRLEASFNTSRSIWQSLPGLDLEA